MSTLLSMLRSKKALATIAGVIAVILSRYLGVPEETATQIAGLIVAYVLGQGLADAGKERAAVEARVRAEVAALPDERAVADALAAEVERGRS